MENIGKEKLQTKPGKVNNSAHKINWTEERIISKINISLQASEEIGLSGP